jgi:hypothetical protein
VVIHRRAAGLDQEHVAATDGLLRGVAAQKGASALLVGLSEALTLPGCSHIPEDRPFWRLPCNTLKKRPASSVQSLQFVRKDHPISSQSLSTYSDSIQPANCSH